MQIEALRDCLWEEVKPQVDEVVFPNGKQLIVLAKGLLVNLGLRDRPLQTRALSLLTLLGVIHRLDRHTTLTM